MRTFYFLLLILITVLPVFPQVSGKIIDANSGLPVEDATVILNNFNITAVSDADGNFFFDTAPSTYILTFERIGYRSVKDTINFLTKSLKIIHLFPSTVTFGEVTVTSTRFEQFIRDIPLSLEVIDKENITGSTAVSVPDAISNEPGIALLRDGIWGTDISIRGLGRQNIVTLVDGNRIETASSHAAALALVDVNDIEKIEVLKGGISSIYGTGAVGGVVNISTKGITYSDKFHFGGSVISGYNTVNKGGSGYLSLMSSTSTWHAKLSGTFRSADNVKTPSGILPNSMFRDNNFSASLGYRPFKNNELILKYQRFNGTDIGIPGGSSFPSSASAKYLLAERNMFSAEYAAKELFSSMENLSVKYFFQQIKRDVELKVNPNPTTTQTVTPSAVHTTNGVQLNTNWMISDFNRLAAGIDIWQREYKGIRETKVVNPSGIRITGDFPVPNSKYLSSGIFAQNETSLLNNNLKVLIGARYDFINISNKDALNPSYIIVNGVRNDNPPHTAISSFKAGETDDKSWSGNIGLLYTIMKDYDITFNAAHSFRSPVLEERYQYINLGGNIYLGNPALKPEQGNLFDIGFRIWKPTLSFKANAFLNYFTDLVADQRDTGIVFRKANIGKARLYGYDLGFEYNFWSSLVVHGNLSYVRGENTANNTNLQQIAPLNGKLGLKFPFLTYLYADVNTAFFTKQENTAPGEVATPGYNTIDIMISTSEIKFSAVKFKFYGGVENILDKSYKQFLSTNRGFIKDEPGRNFFLKLQVNW